MYCLCNTLRILVSDGFTLTLDGIIREFDFEENLSGLKINFQKQKCLDRWQEIF